MSIAIHRTEGPALEGVEFGAVYRIRAPRSGEPWNLYKVDGDCGVDSIEPLDAYLAHTNPEISILPIVDEAGDSESCALLYRFSWPY